MNESVPVALARFEQRLGTLEHNVERGLSDLARNTRDRLEEIERNVHWIRDEILEGHPPRLSVRTRLHDLEGAQHLVVQLAQQAAELGKHRASYRREALAWAAALVAIASLVIGRM